MDQHPQLSTTSDEPAPARASQGIDDSQRQTEPDELPRGPKRDARIARPASNKSCMTLPALGASSSISVVAGTNESATAAR